MKFSYFTLKRAALMAFLAVSFFILNHALLPESTEAQVAPTCDMSAPAAVAPNILFGIGWGALNATHAAYLLTGNTFYNSSDVASPTTGDFYYAVIATTTTKMKATSGSGTINVCFDQGANTGTYNDCLSRTPHVICSRTVAVSSVADAQAPTAPSNLTATAVSSSQVNLTWTPSTDNVGVSGYVIYTNGANPISASLNTSYQISGLTSGTSYSFVVISYDAVGNVSPASNTANASTLGVYPTPAYATPAYATPAYPTPSGGTISWSAPVGIPHPGDWFLKTSGTMQTVPAGGSSYTFSGNGTAASPVIFQASGKPRFTGTVVISGSYVIVDSIEVSGAQVIFQGDHLALRNSEVHNFNPGTNNTTVYINDNSSNIVIYKNLIHDNGDPLATTEIDVVGIGAGPGSQRIWIVDNTMYNHGGDSVLLGHNQKNTVGYVYIGRNIFHNDRENAVDIKEVSNIVVSQNVAYGYRVPPGTNPSAEGAAIVTHYCPINTHIIDNVIRDSQIGISSASLRTDCPQITTNSIMGNSISDIIGIGIQGWGASKIVKIVNNTLSNIGGNGIDFANAISGSLIENNIFRNVAGLDVSLTGATMPQRNNLPDTLNPMFAGEAQHDFKLTATSPAVNAGIASTAYTDFQNSIGVSAAYDIDGQPRPQGPAWDIGAYESSFTTLPTSDTQPPTAPSNLSASAVSSSQVNLSWTASTDNVGVAGYVVYRNGANPVAAYTNSYQATTLLPSTFYSFNVVAYDAKGNPSATSTSASATTLAGAYPTPAYTYQTPVAGTPKFSIGDRVQTTASLNVRQTASAAGTVLGVQAIGLKGTVLAGPTLADGLNWWSINYDTNPDGWSVQDYLEKIAATSYTYQTPASYTYQTPASYTYQTPAAYQTPVNLTYTYQTPASYTYQTPITATYPYQTPVTYVTPVNNKPATPPGLANRLKPIQDKLLNLSQRISADPTLVNLNTYVAELQVISAELNAVQVSDGTTSTYTTPASSSGTFTKALKPGMSDPEVTLLQNKLTSLGFYTGPITGYFGDLTKAAVIAFQQAHGLEPVGSVGPLTRSELNR